MLAHTIVGSMRRYCTTCNMNDICIIHYQHQLHKVDSVSCHATARHWCSKKAYQ